MGSAASARSFFPPRLHRPALTSSQPPPTPHPHPPRPQVFFAKVLRTATEDEVRALFSRFGRVFEVNLFRAFQVLGGIAGRGGGRGPPKLLINCTLRV